MAWSAKALALGEQLGDRQVVAYALTNMGANQVLADTPEAPAQLEQSLALALREGFEDDAGRAYVNLVWWPILRRRFDLVDRHLEEGFEYCSERGLDLWRLFLVGCRARRELDRGSWTAAADAAGLALRDRRTWPVPRVFALTVLGLVRARRGDPDVWPLLDEALALAEPSGELQRIGPVAAARAETAWLQARHERVAMETEAALELALSRQAPWAIGELACWRRRAGITEEVQGVVAAPYAAELAGDRGRAAELWTDLGCPYDAALALAGADDDRALRGALDGLQPLGAQPAAAIVARRLRERGVRGLPRGPRGHDEREPGRADGARGRGARRSSARACATPTSPSACSSPRRRSATTSRRSCASSTCARAARRAPRPGGSASRAKIGSAADPISGCRSDAAGRVCSYGRAAPHPDPRRPR